MNRIVRLREFVQRFTNLVDDTASGEARLLHAGEGLLAELVRHDDWLPDAYTAAGADTYRQYLLYC